MRLIMTATVILVMSNYALAAPSLEQKCQGGKNEAAGKLAACVAKAEKQFIAKADAVAYSEALTRCSAKFTIKWAKLEQAASSAGAACPTIADDAAIGNFINACSDAIAAALAGSALIDDPLTCNSSVATCSSNYAGCTASLGTCNGNYSACSASLASCTTDYTTCGSSLSICSGGNAAAADVLDGKTFSSNAGLGNSGAMPNNGAITMTPGASPQSIAAGYHNGSGTVEGDADLIASNIKGGVDLFGTAGTLLTGLPKSGQTTSYGAASDGAVQAGSVSFTDNGDGTITDHVTGLMWEKKDDSGGIHDKDNTYTWGMTSPPYTMNGTIVSVFLATLNAGAGFAGHTDWRIPNVKELLSIVDYGQSDPAVSPVFKDLCTPACNITTCSCARSGLHWSSTTYNGYAGFSSDIADAYAIIFQDGGVTTGNSALAGGCKKGCGLYARAVRGGL